VTACKPLGFAALLARMPNKFVAQHKKVEERAKRRRAAQAKRLLELDLIRAVGIKSSSAAEWQDTVADFIAR
jgi:hypothetical protein